MAMAVVWLFAVPLGLILFVYTCISAAKKRGDIHFTVSPTLPHCPHTCLFRWLPSLRRNMSWVAWLTFRLEAVVDEKGGAVMHDRLNRMEDTC
eukprot:1454480-Rhodomonas_salina.1